MRWSNGNGTSQNRRRKRAGTVASGGGAPAETNANESGTHADGGIGGPHSGGGRYGTLLLGLLLASSGTAGGAAGASSSSAAATNVNVVRSQAHTSRRGRHQGHHGRRGQEQNRRRRRPTAGQQEQEQTAHHQDLEEELLRQRNTNGQQRDSADTEQNLLLGVPPVRVRSASGRGIAFLPPELASSTSTSTATSTTTRPTRTRTTPATRDRTTRDTTDRNNRSPRQQQKQGTSRGGLLRVPCSISICPDDHHPWRRNPTSISQRDHHHHHHHHQDHNRHHPHPTSSLQAFVDTGAEVTVLSAEAAQRAGLLHLLDRRYAGRATGVGSCRVLGRLPAGCAALVLGEATEGSDGMVTLPCPPLTVLEGNGLTEGMDLLIGLDVLDEYGASISLRGQGTLTMDPPPTTTRASSSANSSPNSPPPRLVIALARNDLDDNNINNNKDAQRKVAQHVQKSSSPPPSSSVASPPQHLGADADIVPRDASNAEVVGTSSRSRAVPIRRKGRGRDDDQDLLADLELLEQEATFSSQFSSGSDWNESDATTSHRTTLATAKAGAVSEEEEEETDDESDVNDYADDFDMSGM